METVLPARWFAKCAFGAVVTLLGCGWATAWFGQGLQLTSVATRDGTMVTFNRYRHESIPDAALVGSSLAFRLKEEYFATSGIRNLAIAGGSPVTGLEIVANQRSLPRIILVEVNVLSRSTDTALVAKYSMPEYEQPLFFRPVRAAVAGYENWIHAPPNHLQVSAALGQLLKQPPSDFDSHIYAERAVQQLNEEDPTIATHMNVKRMQELIPELARRGARLLLFELPYSGPIENTRSVKITRQIVHTGFPDPRQWLRIDYARNELRWADGVHLDERSALIVSQSIDKALTSALNPR